MDFRLMQILLLEYGEKVEIKESLLAALSGGWRRAQQSALGNTAGNLVRRWGSNVGFGLNQRGLCKYASYDKRMLDKSGVRRMRRMRPNDRRVRCRAGGKIVRPDRGMYDRQKGSEYCIEEQESRNDQPLHTGCPRPDGA